MDEILQASFPYQLAAVFVAILLLTAPLLGSGARTAIAGLLALGAGALAVVAFMEGTTRRTLDVINPFMRDGGEPGEPFLYITEQVSAAGFWWPSVAAISLLVPAALLYLRREHPKGSPSPVAQACWVGLWALTLRLALEKAAAPPGFVWGIGLTNISLIILPFLGGYAGARGQSFGGFLFALLGHALILRGVITVFAYFATVYGLGTHLDVAVVEDFAPAGFGNIDLKDAGPTERWFRAIALAQMMFWVVLTLVAGLILGIVPYLIARRRAA
jgi:hypothetical protein